MITKYSQYLKRDNLMKKTFIFTLSMGSLTMLVDVGITVGSRYVQSILEMLVRKLNSCLGLYMLHSGEELLT
jgi:hypothetical protein